MLYKAFFAEKYDLFGELGCSPVLSPKGAHYPSPECSERFFAALFAAFRRTVTSGTPFEAYETDFLSDHLLPTQGLASDSRGLQQYFDGMAQAAGAAGLSVQLCMPTAGIVLASAAWPAMTQGRVSTDYATENAPNSTWAKTYNIGIGSLLFWAVGLQPSKDLTWTTPHQPGGACDHDNPNVELDVVLAVLSCGPVGIGDGIDLTNVTLAKMTADSDGRILPPSKPLTALDSSFVPPATPAPATNQPLVGFLPLMPGASGCPSPGGASFPAQCTPAAEQTHTSIPLQPDYAARLFDMQASADGAVASWRILLSLHLGDFTPTASDLLPLPGLSALGAYRELRWRRCVNGSAAFGSGLEPLEHTALPNIQSGKGSPSEPKVPWRMMTLYPNLPVDGSQNTTAWVLLGEADKIVGVSPVRFRSVGVVRADGGSCLCFELSAAPTETVTVGAVTPGGTFVERGFGSGHGRICDADAQS